MTDRREAAGERGSDLPAGRAAASTLWMADVQTFVLKGSLICVLLYLAWLPLQGGFIRFLAAGAEGLLRTFEQPPVITSLGAHGGVIVIRTFLTGLDQPMTVWSGWVLHFLLVASLTLVLSLPFGTRGERAVLTCLTLGVGLFVSLAFSVVRIQSAAEQHASTQLGVTLYTAGEKQWIGLLSWGLGVTGLLLLPASLVLMSYLLTGAGHVRFATASTRGTGSREGGRRLFWAATSGGVAVVFALNLWVLIGTRAPDDPGAHNEGWEKILRLNSSFAPALVNVGGVREKEGNLEAAVALYRRALELDPERVAAHYNLGNALFRLGRYPAAAGAFEESIRREPDNAPARKNLAVVFLQLNRPCQALTHLRYAMQLDIAMQTDARMMEQVRRLQPLCPAAGAGPAPASVPGTSTD